MVVTQIGPIAFLVDGENASPDFIGDMLDEVTKYGPITIRRVYGNWSTSQMGSWKNKLEEHALMAEMVVPYVRGKNAVDIRLVIDAMDIIRKGVVKGFCIVSSDSDFTSLAMKIREEGLFAIGIGESKTPPSLRRAYDIFISTENLALSRSDGHDIGPENEDKTGAHGLQKGKTIAGVTEDRTLRPLDSLQILTRAYDNVVGEGGKVHLSLLQESVRRLDSGFDPRTYGHKKLITLIRDLPSFLVQQEPNQGSGGVYVMVREGQSKAKVRGRVER